MKLSQSTRAILATYEKYDRRLTVISFDQFGARRFTYMQYGFHSALLQTAKLLKHNLTVRIFIDLPDALSSPSELDKIPTAYLFEPDPDEVI